MDNEKVKTGIQIFGAVLFVLCIGGFVWSNCRPGANAPLTPEGQKRMNDLERQRP